MNLLLLFFPKLFPMIPPIIIIPLHPVPYKYKLILVVFVVDEKNMICYHSITELDELQHHLQPKNYCFFFHFFSIDFYWNYHYCQLCCSCTFFSSHLVVDIVSVGLSYYHQYHHTISPFTNSSMIIIVTTTGTFWPNQLFFSPKYDECLCHILYN